MLGLGLVVVTTTGALIVYSPEWTRWTNSDVFSVTTSDHSVSITAALQIVDAAHPDFSAGSVNVYGGLYEVFSADEDSHPGFWGVDPGSGRITGYANPNSGFMALMEQIHECFFSCDSYPAHLPFLAEPVPTLGWHWLEGVTWAALLLGLGGLLLIFLAISGLVLWWPGIRRWRRGFRVRLGKGRYARDYDLHQLVGLVAVPFLLMWGITGASFEFHWVSTAWYAVTGGQQVADEEFTSAEPAATATDIGPAAALAAAQAQAGPNAPVTYLSLPDVDDPAGVYSFYFARGFDQYEHGAYPGEYGVDVDRYDATRTHVNDLGQATTVSNQLLDNWGGALFHYGQKFNGWWRIFWFVFGLTPLLLALTGLSTWLAKRSVAKRRRQAATMRDTAATAPADAPTDPVPR